MHGGKSLSGIASATWQTGRYSKVLPGNIATRYETARNDPHLYALRDEVALVDARISEMLGAMAEINHPPTATKMWPDVLQLIEQRRKLVESERKRLVELQQVLTLEQAQSMIAAIAESVRRHVSDRAALSAITDDLARLMHGDAHRETAGHAAIPAPAALPKTGGDRG